MPTRRRPGPAQLSRPSAPELGRDLLGSQSKGYQDTRTIPPDAAKGCQVRRATWRRQREQASELSGRAGAGKDLAHNGGGEKAAGRHFRRMCILFCIDLVPVFEQILRQPKLLLLSLVLCRAGRELPAARQRPQRPDGQQATWRRRSLPFWMQHAALSRAGTKLALCLDESQISITRAQVFDSGAQHRKSPFFVPCRSRRTVFRHDEVGHALWKHERTVREAE